MRTTENTPIARQVRARLLDRRRAETLALLQQQAAADVVLVHRLQAGDRDRSDIGVRSRGDAKGDVQRVVGRLQGDRRQIDLGQRVSGFAEGGEQALLCGQHIGGDGRRAGGQAELVAHVGRHVAVDRDAAEMELRSRIECPPPLRPADRPAPAPAGRAGRDRQAAARRW